MCLAPSAAAPGGEIPHVPIQGFIQAFFKVVGGPVPKEAARLADVPFHLDNPYEGLMG